MSKPGTQPRLPSSASASSSQGRKPAQSKRSEAGANAPDLPQQAQPQVSEQLQRVLATLIDKQAKNLVMLDVSSLVCYTDFLLIADGTSSTHVQALADACAALLKKPGIAGARVEADPSATWILLDGGDFVVHLFQPEARKYYNLDDLWLDGRRVEVA